jgi:hypothetical protein
VDQYPALGAVFGPDLDELIDVASAQLGLAHHLLELLVQRFVAARPINLRVNLGEQQRQERLEVSVQRLLPGAIVVDGHWQSPCAGLAMIRVGRKSFPFPSHLAYSASASQPKHEAIAKNHRISVTFASRPSPLLTNEPRIPGG